MLVNEKNKEMERWGSLVTLLSSILFFVFVCLFCDASSLWNFCARFSDVISWETVGGVAKCRLFSQANLESRNPNLMVLLFFFFKKNYYTIVNKL